MSRLPVRRRSAARLLVLDPDDRLLLVHDSDPGAPSRPSWWITPGGGLDPGEDVTTAALRELAEETGRVAEASELLGPVWSRHVTHLFSDHRAEQHETFFVLRTPTFRPSGTTLTASEQASVLGYRWWAAGELASTSEDVWPRQLPALLPGLLAALATGVPPATELPASEETPGA